MITKATFDFLKQVALHNDRDWFQAHKGDYECSLKTVWNFVGALIPEISKIEPAIPSDLNPKDCVMRIYRDVRFSKNKAPYKKNFGIAISPKGKNFDGAGFYINLEPKNSFIAGGSWMPSAEHLKSIRQEIDYNGDEFHQIIGKSSFKSYFADLDREDVLKTSPKGYLSDHQDIEYLKLKSFTVSHRLKDEEFIKPDVINYVLDVFKELNPFIQFLRTAIT